MAAYSLTTSASEGVRARVRTPGKYIVMFAAAALAVIFGATSLLRRVDHGAAFRPAAEKPAAGPANAVALPEFLVDLSPDQDGRVTYLRLSASVLMSKRAGARGVERVTEAAPQIGERLTFLLRGLTPQDFEGEAGMARVKTEMLRRVNLVIAPDEAQDVVISDLVIQ
jgi:flagellar FliL protein